MDRTRFIHTSEFNLPVEALFNWHERPGAFDRLNPPFMPVKVLRNDGHIRDGAKVLLKVPDSFYGINWELEHRDYQQYRQFYDHQISGPFRSWEHKHLFSENGPNKSTLEEQITYSWPAIPIFGRVADRIFGARLENLFKFRHHRTANDLLLHKKYQADKSLKFLIAGSSGMLGKNLISFLTTGGHQVTRLVRQKHGQDPWWSPDTGDLNPEFIEGYDVIINLAGANIGSGYWSKKRKKQILDSRVMTTNLLAKTIATLSRPPAVFIVASATGYYGDREDELLTEASAAGEGFLREVTGHWEKASHPAVEAGIRTVNLRFGVILSGRHDLLARIKPAFLSGLGTIMGSGDQYFPWVAVDDAVASIYHASYTINLHGAVNVVAPEPVTSGIFFRTLGNVLRRPVFLKIPVPVIKTLLGQMGEELLLFSTRVVPEKLLETGFEFQFPHLEKTLRFLFGRFRD